MSTQQYGLVGVPNVTITMITTHEEDDKMSVNDKGERLPVAAVTKRKLSFDKYRLGVSYSKDKEQSAQLPAMFPVFN